MSIMIEKVARNVEHIFTQKENCMHLWIFIVEHIFTQKEDCMHLLIQLKTFELLCNDFINNLKEE